MSDDPNDEILSLVFQAKRDLAKRVGLEKQAEKEQVKAAKHQLEAAINAVRSGKYREALRLFSKLQAIIEESKLIESEWAELYVAQAICHARLGQRQEMQKAWRRARLLEPDNEILKGIAERLGLVP